jgi:hypothetical protein
MDAPLGDQFDRRVDHGLAQVTVVVRAFRGHAAARSAP